MRNHFCGFLFPFTENIRGTRKIIFSIWRLEYGILIDNGKIYEFTERQGMQLRFEIPEGFWSLFRSVNRETYIEALMAINEEYQYSNYFLTREVCIQVLRDLYMKKQIELKREEDETEFDMLETPSARILNWLIRKGWLKKIED